MEAKYQNLRKPIIKMIYLRGHMSNHEDGSPKQMYDMYAMLCERRRADNDSGTKMQTRTQ